MLVPVMATRLTFPTCNGGEIFQQVEKVDSLWPSDALWQHRSGSTLAQVMACCLMAPSHYLNQCWLIISEVQWHSFEGNFRRDTSAIDHCKSFRCQWVNSALFFPQVVALHAVKVPVTQNLNANMSGYLPLHCIYQLLKSRAFSKHRVAIKVSVIKNTKAWRKFPPFYRQYFEMHLLCKWIYFF